jgi:hypothetical protein
MFDDLLPIASFQSGSTSLLERVWRLKINGALRSTDGQRAPLGSDGEPHRSVSRVISAPEVVAPDYEEAHGHNAMRRL